MDIESKVIKLLINKEKEIFAELVLYDEVMGDYEMVMLEITIENEKSNYKNYNFFLALQELRKDLEMKNIQIICNGAAKNIYPSPMQLSMGTGRIAYKLYMGKQARHSDIVDIFDCNEKFQFVSVKEQFEYYNEWLKNLEN